MRPVCPGFAGVLAPCLLGGRKLAGGQLVKNGAIGLDQLPEPHSDIATQRDNRRKHSLSRAVARHRFFPASETVPVQRTPSARIRWTALACLQAPRVKVRQA